MACAPLLNAPRKKEEKKERNEGTRKEGTMGNSKAFGFQPELTDKESVELDFTHLDEITDKLLLHGGDSEMVSALVDRAWDDIMSMKHVALKAIAERNMLVDWIEEHVCCANPASDDCPGCPTPQECPFESSKQRSSKLKGAYRHPRKSVSYAVVRF